MIIEIRERLKTFYRSTPFAWIDAIPRLFINDLMAYPIFNSWKSAQGHLSDADIKYLAIGASDVVATGSYPQSYANTIRDVAKASGSTASFKTYNCSLWGSYARQIHGRLRYLKNKYPEARFDFCTVLVGYNDGLWNIPPDEFEADLEGLLVSALQCCDHVYLLDAKDLKKMPGLTGFPWMVEKFLSNKEIWRYADRYQIKLKKVVERIGSDRLHIVPIREKWTYTGETELTMDGLHPNIAGYNKIARVILDKLEENSDIMSKLRIDKFIS